MVVIKMGINKEDILLGLEKEEVSWTQQKLYEIIERIEICEQKINQILDYLQLKKNEV